MERYLREQTNPKQFVSGIDFYQQEDSVYITDIGYYPYTKLHEVSRTLGIKEHIICFCTKGSGYVKFDTNELEIKENDYFIIPQNTTHQYYANPKKGWGMYFIHFAGVESDKFVNGHVHHGKLNQFQLKLIYTILNHTLFQLEFDQSELSVGFINSSFAYLLECLDNFYSNKDIYSKNDEIINNFINYLENNISEKVSICSLTTNLNISQSTLNNVVRKEFGLTPMQYSNKMKIDIAANILENTERKVIDVAHMVGFDDPYHFSKKFKVIKGISPNKYRTQHQLKRKNRD